jgi:ABC-type transport system involved in cytochrome c biogenesis ATPase subunit/GNAT superfamily N-acetyltransferase
MSYVHVETAGLKKSQRILTVRGAHGGASRIALSAFALVGPGDELRIRNGGPTCIVDVKASAENEWIPVAPAYQSRTVLKVGNDTYPLTFTEIEDETQLREYLRLESFHYKGRVLNEDPSGPVATYKGIGGRKGVLIATLKAGPRTRVVGYIELQMPLMMCKPRHDLFQLPFYHTARDIKWSTWLGDGQRYLNQIVRIARVVVDPEFRGLGLSTKLVEQAKPYALERWTIGGRRPLFIEISAEMLRYVDFVTKAGLIFAGNTEGNLERISNDLRSIENGASGKSQIMGLQKKYHAAFSAYCKKKKRSFEEASIILAEMLGKRNLRERMPTDEWLALRSMLRAPIPYHIAGLDEISAQYVVDCSAARQKTTGVTSQVTESAKVSAHWRRRKEPISLKHESLEVWIDHALELTPYVRLAMDSFGIESSHLRTRLVGPVDIDLVGGNVALITGSSGAGKSVLLDALSNDPLPKGLILRSPINTKPKSKVSKLRRLQKQTPLLQYFGEKYGAEAAFDALCRVGLSEAMVFIKPFSLLSTGQQYRAMLADMVLKRADIWLIDEFCSNLDPTTSAVIAAQTRRLARELGVVVVAAAANCTHFVDSLLPDVVYVVRTGGDVHRLGQKEFKRGCYEKGV